MNRPSCSICSRKYRGTSVPLPELPTQSPVRYLYVFVSECFFVCVLFKVGLWIVHGFQVRMLGINSTVSILTFWMFLTLLWTAALTSGEDEIMIITYSWQKMLQLWPARASCLDLDIPPELQIKPLNRKKGNRVGVLWKNSCSKIFNV